MRERWFQWVGLAGTYAFVALVLVVYSLAGPHGARPSGGQTLADWLDERMAKEEEVVPMNTLDLLRQRKTGQQIGGEPMNTLDLLRQRKSAPSAAATGQTDFEALLPPPSGAVDPDSYFDEEADRRARAEIMIHEAAVEAQKRAIGMPGAGGLLMRALAATVIRRYDRGATVRDRAVVYAETVDWLSRRRLMLIGPPGVHHMMINRAIAMLTDPATAPSEWWADATPLPEERHPVREWVAGIFD